MTKLNRGTLLDSELISLRSQDEYEMEDSLMIYRIPTSLTLTAAGGYTPATSFARPTGEYFDPYDHYLSSYPDMAEFEDTTGGNSDGFLYNEINEAISSDAEYIQVKLTGPASTTPNLGSGDNILAIRLSPVTAPVENTGITFRMRYASPVFGGTQDQISLTIGGYSTLISGGIGEGSFTDFTHVFTAQEVADTNWQRLVALITSANVSGAGVSDESLLKIAWMELEVPSAAEGTSIYEGKGSVTPIIARRDRFDEFGEGLIFSVQYRLTIPYRDRDGILIDGFRITDRVVLTSTKDNDLYNRDFEIRDIHRTTDIAQRRITLHDIER